MQRFRFGFWRGFVKLFMSLFTSLFMGLSLFLVIGLGWQQGAIAENTAPNEPAEIEQSAPSPARLDANTISSEKLSQFTQAYLKVVDLIDLREGELQAAETELESERIQTEIEAVALQEIEAAGLTLQEYLQLLGLANIDAEFGERVTAQLQEMGS